MTTTYAVIQPPFAADHILQCCIVGQEQCRVAINPRIALGAVVVNQQQRLPETGFDTADDAV